MGCVPVASVTVKKASAGRYAAAWRAARRMPSFNACAAAAHVVPAGATVTANAAAAMQVIFVFFSDHGCSIVLLDFILLVT